MFIVISGFLESRQLPSHVGVLEPLPGQKHYLERGVWSVPGGNAQIPQGGEFLVFAGEELGAL